MQFFNVADSGDTNFKYFKHYVLLCRFYIESEQHIHVCSGVKHTIFLFTCTA